jgi:hypothetical protein
MTRATASSGAAAALLLASLTALVPSCDVDSYCLDCFDGGGAVGDGGGGSGDGGGGMDGPLHDSGPRPDACLPSGPELCDGVDNDCNGEVDDGVPGVGDPCGTDVGECTAGTTDCVDGMAGVCVGSYVAPTPEACDSKDNDCDGDIDNGDPGGGVICGSDTGDCKSGVTQCLGGAVDCVGDVGPASELCDGADNDCDGMFDEGDPGGGAACGVTDVGECGLGVETCAGGVIQCLGHVDPVLDLCDGLDNDCDGTPDQDFDFLTDRNNCGDCGIECTAPFAFTYCAGGACAVLACQSDHWNINGVYADGCEYACVFRGAEVCGDPDGDGNADDDCDGLVDEGLTPPPICDPDGACAGTTPTCALAGWKCTYGPPVQTDSAGNIVPETLCDGIDNDCDGMIDEAFPTKGQACDNGMLGQCKGTGSIQCAGTGAVACVITMPGGSPIAESCDGADNDCDGLTDDGDLNAWVQISGGGIGTKWMFAYEASRPDATGGSAGASGARPCAKPAALPWTNITQPQAEAQCAVIGARLCSEAEWERACQTGSTCTWSYDTSCTTYQATKCNGNDYDCDSGTAGDQDCLLAAGAKTLCHANWGATDIFDLSGNVKEWTLERSAGVNPLRGGSYNNTSVGISCDFDFAVADDAFLFPNVGFRCCRDTAPPP